MIFTLPRFCNAAFIPAASRSYRNISSAGTSGSLTFLPGLIVTAYWSLPDSAIWLCFAVNTQHRGQNKFLWFAENRHCARWGKTGEYFSHDWSYLSIWSKLQSSAATMRGRLLNLSRLPKSKFSLTLIIKMPISICFLYSWEKNFFVCSTSTFLIL